MSKESEGKDSQYDIFLKHIKTLNCKLKKLPSMHESSGFMMLFAFTTRAYINVPICRRKHMVSMHITTMHQAQGRKLSKALTRQPFGISTS
jgi:hypothetical protein